jgi:hypothetical protein
MNSNTNLDLDREAWLTEAAQFILDDIIKPEMPAGWHPATGFRVALGYAPRSTARSKTIAVCIASAASGDGVNEIFVTPAIDDSVDILAALAHEMVHYSDDCESGHKNHFARLARAIGLEGKLTSTHAGQVLTEKLQDIVATLGHIPHAKIDLGKAKPKQSTRMLKVFCPDTECNFSYRTSQTNIDKISDFLCPACNAHDMETD